MSSHEFSRVKSRVLKRYAELLLRAIHQLGGRERYVALVELEDLLGLESDLMVHLCETRLFGEVHVADRVAADLANDTEFRSALERAWIQGCFATPHVRVRPEIVRLTASELLADQSSSKKRKHNAKTKAKRA